MLEEEDSRLQVHNNAFILEHSEIVKGSLPLDLDKLNVTPAKLQTFSLTEMMEKAESVLGRRTQSAAKTNFD